MGGGGFTYGSASAAGMIFGSASAAGPIGGGPTAGGIGSFGASGLNSNSKSFGSNNNNLSGKNPIGGAASGFQFGGASQFGGMGGSFGAGNMAAPANNDPYANIDIDLSKVKKAEKPSKPFEQRTEEEKVAAKT